MYATGPMVNLFTVVLGILSIILLAVGLRGLMTKRPLIVRARWNALFITLALLPMIIQQVWIAFSGGGGGSAAGMVLFWTPPILFGAALIVVWYRSRGYIAHGISDRVIREGLLQATEKMQLPCDERLAAIHLKTVGADLSVKGWSWSGGARIEIHPRTQGTVLDRIVHTMNEQFRVEPLPAAPASYLFPTALGAVMAVLAVVMILVSRQL